MSKHTPGTWGSFSRVNEHGLPEVVVTASNGCPLAVVGNHAEHEANARLIAAAPDLLEALSSLNAEVSAIGGFAFDVKRLLGDEHWDRLINAVGDARKAIAKAEGK